MLMLVVSYILTNWITVFKKCFLVSKVRLLSRFARENQYNRTEKVAAILKVLQCEIFEILDTGYFYTTKFLWVGDISSTIG
jgi:hypothetical protein